MLTRHSVRKLNVSAYRKTQSSRLWARGRSLQARPLQLRRGPPRVCTPAAHRKLSAAKPLARGWRWPVIIRGTHIVKYLLFILIQYNKVLAFFYFLSEIKKILLKPVVRKWVVLRQSDLWTLTSFGNTFPCKQRRVIFAWAGWLIWEHLLLKIAMPHPLFNLRVRTLTINSGDVPPNMFGHVPPCQSNFV